MLKQHKFFKIFQKICQMNKEVYLIYMILLSCLTLILSHQICIRYFCNGSKNMVLEKFDQKVILAEIDLLLNCLQEQNISNLDLILTLYASGN